MKNPYIDDDIRTLTSTGKKKKNVSTRASNRGPRGSISESSSFSNTDLPASEYTNLKNAANAINPDSVQSRIGELSNQLRDRISGFSNAQKQKINNDALSRGVGAANFTQLRGDEIDRGASQAYSTGLEQIYSDFENKRLQAGQISGDLISKLLGLKQAEKGKKLESDVAKRQIQLQAGIANQNYSLGLGTQAIQDLAAILSSLK